MNAIDGKNTLVAGFLCALIAAPQIVNAQEVILYGTAIVGATEAVASDTNVEVTDADTYNAVVGGLAIEVKRDTWGDDKIVSEGTSEADKNRVIVKGGAKEWWRNIHWQWTETKEVFYRYYWRYELLCLR